MKYSIQMHEARKLHFDLRLEIGGVLKSWVLPKGPSMIPSEKRLAVLTEDHDLSYAFFEGVIEKGYGKGTVLLWDRGTFRNIRKNAADKEISLKTSFRDGHINIWINGKKLKGGFSLIRFREDNWLLVKQRDDHAKERGDIVKKEPHSVKSGLTLSELRKA